MGLSDDVSRILEQQIDVRYSIRSPVHLLKSLCPLVSPYKCEHSDMPIILNDTSFDAVDRHCSHEPPYSQTVFCCPRLLEETTVTRQLLGKRISVGENKHAAIKNWTPCFYEVRIVSDNICSKQKVLAIS
jgi:hypothetical protein